MKIVFSQTQFNSVVDFISSQGKFSKNEISQTLTSTIKELSKTSEPFAETMGFFVVRETNFDDMTEYMHIFADISYNKSDQDFVEINIYEGMNLN